MRRVLGLIVLAAAAIASAPASAQFGHHPPPRSQTPQQVDCDHIPAGMGMDKATCEQMNQMSAGYNAAQTDPSATRPGDEAMTCDQIKAELMQQPWQAPNQTHVAEAQAATRAQMATTAQLQAEGTAMAARESSENLAASGLSMVNPVAGAAAQSALNAQQQAEQAALNAKAKAELEPEAQRTMRATGTLMGDANAQLQSNPRTGRLMYLASQKNCHNF